MKVKKYRVYADCLMKTKIMRVEPRPHYNMELDILVVLGRREYFKALMMTSNMIESFLRRFYVQSFRTKSGGKLLARDVDDINRINLSSIIDWANCKNMKVKEVYALPYPKKKIVNNKQYNVLILLRNVRNDIAHNYYLNYDENIEPAYAEKVIHSAIPVLSNLIKKYVSFRNSSHNLTKNKKTSKTP